MGWGDSPPGVDWKADIDFVDDCLRQRGLEFDAVYSSELERSRQTAIIHAVRFGIEMVNSRLELNEINYGQLLNRKKDSVAKEFPQHKKNPDMVYPGGESFRQMQERSVRLISSLALERPQQTLLIVSHAGVIRGIVSHYLELDYADHLKQRIAFRYVGDLLFEGKNCIRYDELGDPSGFAANGVIELPHVCNEKVI
jgi:broad specificity phosphatase PhoE